MKALHGWGLWVLQASCASVGGDEWFPDQGGSSREAKRICASCPVAEQCLEYALSIPRGEDQFGIYGGKSVRERRRIRNKREQGEEAA